MNAVRRDFEEEGGPPGREFVVSRTESAGVQGVGLQTIRIEDFLNLL